MLLLNVHRKDWRASLYVWRWADGRFRKQRREHWAGEHHQQDTAEALVAATRRRWPEPLN